MFDDPLISLMIMLLLCFMGMLLMFLFVIRSLSTQAAVLREGFTRQQSTLADLEQQIMDITFILRTIQRGPSLPGAAPAADGTSLSLDSVFSGLNAAGGPAGEGPAVLNIAGVPDSTAYAYPSAAGLGPLDEPLPADAFAPRPDAQADDDDLPAGLNLRMGR